VKIFRLFFPITLSLASSFSFPALYALATVDSPPMDFYRPSARPHGRISLSLKGSVLLLFFTSSLPLFSQGLLLFLIRPSSTGRAHGSSQKRAAAVHLFLLFAHAFSFFLFFQPFRPLYAAVPAIDLPPPPKDAGW